MLIHLQDIRKKFNKNVYNEFVSDTYGINTSFCSKHILENDLLIYFTTIYEKITGINTIDMSNLAPIVVNYITNNIVSSGVSSYIFTQSLLSSVWTVPHSLGYKPSKPLITDENGIEIDGIVSNTTINETTISFSQPKRGFAYFS